MAGAPSSALARAHDYGGRAKSYGIGTPTDSGAKHCGADLYTGPRTSCALAHHVFAVFTRGERALGYAPGWVRAAGGPHSRAQRLNCEIAANDHAVVCYGKKSSALVDFGIPTSRSAAVPVAAAPAAFARTTVSPSASAARSCGQLPHHGLRASLPLDADGVSCARARRLVSAWVRVERRSESRGSTCVPAEDDGAPSRTCRVEGWRCTASHSLNGSTTPVLCEKARRRVSFREPL